MNQHPPPDFLMLVPRVYTQYWRLLPLAWLMVTPSPLAAGSLETFLAGLLAAPSDTRFC